MPFSYLKVYGVSPTILQKSILSDFEEKYSFQDFLLLYFYFNLHKNYVLTSYKKNPSFFCENEDILDAIHQQWPKYEQISKNVNIFQMHFQDDFLIFHIFTLGAIQK